MLRFYNTLSRQIEDFVPINPPNVGFYSCGPTVYDYAHIGHARTFIFADILERVLEFNGYKVKRVMNITDVGHLTSDSDTGEDKMEKGAKREKKNVWDIAKFYTDDFMNMLSLLNIKKPEIICRATDHIKQMIKLIEKLEKKGFTYKISDGVYFDTSKLPDYGKLTGLNFSQLQKRLKAGARVEVVSGKKHPTDFALWKFSPSARRVPYGSPSSSGSPKRQMEWDSPWGKGFPGWHIECSAMSMEYLGESIDIHTGGVDHIPIHHTNEIAQSEAAYRTVHGEGASGKPFVKYWLHADHLLVEGEKMSKSLGNFYRVADIGEKGFSPLVLRYLFLTASYRKSMNFTWESLKAAQTALENLQAQIRQLADQISTKKRVSLSEEKLEKVNEYRNKFTSAVNDDLNIPAALAVLWEVVKSNIPPGDKYDLLMLFDEVLGLDLGKASRTRQQTVAPEEILKLAKEREKLRKEKKWDETDKLRRQIEKSGFIVEDTPLGSKIIKK